MLLRVGQLWTSVDTAVHSYLVCIQCVLVVGDVGGLGPQVIHGPYPGAAEETGHPNQTAEH